jgi:hypothetical protein
MKFLARLATGNIALWRTFWLIGVPLAIVWDVSGVCMVLGLGAEEPFLAVVIIVLFTLASAAIPFASVAIWRSASNYPREARWHTPVAIGAKLCAAFSGLVAALSFVTILYFIFYFAYGWYLNS